MKIICDWCKKPMGEKRPLDNDERTHGICLRCAFILKNEYKIIKIIPKVDEGE